MRGAAAGWSIYFSLLDAGEWGLVLQLMSGLLHQYRGRGVVRLTEDIGHRIIAPI